MRVGFIPEQGQGALAAGDRHERAAVVSTGRHFFAGRCNRILLMLQEDVKSICLYFEAPGSHLSVWQHAWPSSSAEGQEVQGQIYQCALSHFYNSAWPGAQAGLIWLPGESFLSIVRKTNSERYLVICLSFTKLGNTFMTDLKGQQKVLLSHGYLSLPPDWTLHVCFCAQVTETTLKADKSYCDQLHIAMNSNHVIQFIHKTQLQTHKPS